MPGLHIFLACKVGFEHNEVVGNNGIEFVILPRPPNLFFVSQ